MIALCFFFNVDSGRVIDCKSLVWLTIRSSGAQWRKHMANTLRTAGFTSCKADADVWLRPAVKADGTKAGQS